eukprot:Skav212887  [mRNA]  locus=scaffold1006:332906:340413:+ [translate_table: standard]
MRVKGAPWWPGWQGGCGARRLARESSTAAEAYREDDDQLGQANQERGERDAQMVGGTQKIMCAITLDAHNRDVQERLVQEKVNSKDAFQWQSMLKCYWKEDRPSQLGLPNPRLVFRPPEYLGNGPRLVVTPLTDRIYALHLCMGCAPAGPAGTGKTESTKDLANAVAKARWRSAEGPRCHAELPPVLQGYVACYVINAAPEMDYLTLGDIYKGERVGCFITMNPGYLGRSELPEGLKALFRPITVMVPDFKLIMENMFMGEGFTEAKALGLKFSTLYVARFDDGELSAPLRWDWCGLDG